MLTVRFVLVNFLRHVISCPAVSLSSPEVGSSRKIRLGFVTSPMATLNLLLSPPLMPFKFCESSPIKVSEHFCNSWNQKSDSAKLHLVVYDGHASCISSETHLRVLIQSESISRESNNENLRIVHGCPYSSITSYLRNRVESSYHNAQGLWSTGFRYFTSYQSCHLSRFFTITRYAFFDLSWIRFHVKHVRNSSIVPFTESFYTNTREKDCIIQVKEKDFVHNCQKTNYHRRLSWAYSQAENINASSFHPN